MKKVFVIMSLLFIICTPAFAFRDVPLAKTPIEGFRGIKWGDPVSKFPGEFEFLEAGLSPSSTQNVYIRKYDKTTIGGAEIGEFNYVFDDRAGFCKVIAALSYSKTSKRRGVRYPKSYSDMLNRFEKIYNACIQQWGTPQKIASPFPGGKYVEYFWLTPIKDNMAFSKLKVIYDDNEGRKLGTLFLSIYTEKEEIEEQEKLDQYLESRSSDF